MSQDSRHPSKGPKTPMSNSETKQNTFGQTFTGKEKRKYVQEIKRQFWRPSVIGASTGYGGKGKEEKEEKLGGGKLKEGETCPHISPFL